MQIESENVSKKLGNVLILDDINFSTPDCKSLVLLGPSGSGKSSLLRVIAGLIIPDSGKIILNGQPIPTEESELLAYRRSIGTVFQSWNLFPHLTALENVALPLYRVHGFTKEEAIDHSMDLLKRFGLEERANKHPGELSGGQSQRVAIVRAVALHPKLLLFDEPTSALDPMMTSEILDLIAELKNEGSDFILVSHHLGFAEKISDYVAFVHQGKVLETTPSIQFFKNPTSSEAKTFLNRVLKY